MSHTVYRIELWKDGRLIDEGAEMHDRAEAKRLAEKGLVEQDAELARLIDVYGSGMEVASFQRDASGWDDE